MPRVVPTSSVTIREGERISPLGVRRVKAILEAQGLIEPLLCYRGTLEVGRRVWDAERLVAARELGWDTVIVTDGSY